MKAEHGEAIRQRFGVEVEVPALPFPRISMAKAQEILKEADYQVPAEKKGDIDPGGERVLGQWVKETYGHDFVFLTDWPVSVRPFYHMRYADEPGITRSFDLIAKGLEITTGAQREHRYECSVRSGAGKGPAPGTDPVLPGLFQVRLPTARRVWFRAVALPDGAVEHPKHPRDGVRVPRTDATAAVRRQFPVLLIRKFIVIPA